MPRQADVGQKESLLSTKSDITYIAATVSADNCNPLHIPRILWLNRGLLSTMTMQELRSRYTGSFLGMGWMLVIPLVQLAIYTFVFGYIYRVGQGNNGMIGYALSLFCGFVPFIMVSESLGAAPNRIIGQPNFVKKVVFPLEILPLVTMCVAAIHALGALVILGLALCFLGEGLHWTILWLPVLVIPPVLLVIGLSWILSSLGVFIRDLTATIQLMIQFVFFLTPITYPLSYVPERVLAIYRLNPLVGVVESFRRVILGGQEPVLIDVLYPLLCGIIFTMAGFYYFQRSRRTFADVI
jgi:lipopolysaccharide transport system permease protein